MRERAKDKGRLQDIIEHANNVTMLIEGYSFEALVADKRTYYSVMKNIEIVGEAAFMISKPFKDAHPETPWKVVQGMRHVLVHDYANIDIKELYNTAVNDMIPLCQQVNKYLSETNWEEWASIKDDIDDTTDPTLQANIETARRMKVKGYPINDIADITGLTSDEINQI